MQQVYKDKVNCNRCDNPNNCRNQGIPFPLRCKNDALCKNVERGHDDEANRLQKRNVQKQTNEGQYDFPVF